MKTAAKLTTIILSTALLFACGNPKKTTVPTTGALVDKDFTAAMQKLEQPERQAMAAWMLRKAFQGGIPANTTIEQALNEQKQWQAEQDAIAAKQAESIARLNNSASIKTTSIQFVPQNPQKYKFSDAFVIGTDITNNTEKTIKAIQIGVRLTNTLDDELDKFQFDIEETLAPHETRHYETQWDLFNDRTIDAVKNAKAAAAYTVLKVVYEDGTKDGI